MDSVGIQTLEPVMLIDENQDNVLDYRKIGQGLLESPIVGQQIMLKKHQSVSSIHKFHGFSILPEEEPKKEEVIKLKVDP